jgi:hypothetical protein
MVALVIVLLVLTFWRRRDSYVRHAFAANAVLMCGGFMLAGYQLTGFILAAR